MMLIIRFTRRRGDALLRGSSGCASLVYTENSKKVNRGIGINVATIVITVAAECKKSCKFAVTAHRMTHIMPQGKWWCVVHERVNTRVDVWRSGRNVGKHLII